MVPNIVDNTETTTDDEKFLIDSKDKSNSIKKLNLNRLKTKTYLIYTVVAILASALSSIVSYYAVRIVKDAFIEKTYKYIKDYYTFEVLRWIISAIFTVGRTFMSVIMMGLLKSRFDDFYAEYGCFLWTIVIIQILSMLI